MMRIAGLLLAAGRGRRFGGDKLLHPLTDGEPVVLASARSLRAALTRAVALVRPDQPQLAARLAALGLEVVEVGDADAGMGHTLAAGVTATADADGWVVALGDMPRLAPATTARVAAALAAGASIAAPVHAGRRGHPVGFAGEWRTALRALHGDTGARHLLAAHAARITALTVDDPGCLLDVDTPADLAALAPPG